MAPRKPTKSRAEGNTDPSQPAQSSEEVTPPPPHSRSLTPPPPVSGPESSDSEADIETLRRAYRRLKRQRRRSRSRSHSPEPKVTRPPEFTGKTSEFKNFLALCDLTFTMQPRTYRSDERKVLFVIAQFRGNALDWAREITTRPDHPLRRNYPAFVEALNNLYLDRNACMVASQKLLNLSQTDSVSSYATKFQSLASGLEFGDSSLRDMFYHKLDSGIKDRLVMMEMAPTLQGLINQAITLDQRSYQRRLEDQTAALYGGRRKDDTKPIPKPDHSTPKTQNPRNDSRATSYAPSKPGPLRSSAPPSKPRGPLSDAEKQRRREQGLCHYCGGPGHFADACPLAPQNRQTQPSVNALESSNPTPVLSSNPTPVVYPENWESQDPPRQGD